MICGETIIASLDIIAKLMNKLRLKREIFDL